MQAVRSRPWTVLGATGLILATGYKQQKAESKRLEEKKLKKVLVLPFYRMRIVEERAPTSLSSLTSRGGIVGGGKKTIEMPVDELVTLIHEAAQDPGIVGLYGVFGHGGTLATGGWAHLEEIRTALRVFANSHIQHKEPVVLLGENEDDYGVEQLLPKQRRQQQQEARRERKSMYVYANTLANPVGSASMKDYYIASVFGNIHLQSQGDVNLFGLHATNTFFKEFLNKYGIGVHVWKHGVYKNAANSFTHSSYTREHYENTAGVLLPIHQYVCNSIYSSRYKYLKKYDASNNDGGFWEMVTCAGSLPAKIALQIGFVDFISRMDPLDVLLKHNMKQKESTGNSKTRGSDESDKDSKVEKDTDDEPSPFESWKSETDFEHFTADAKIDVSAYARQKAMERAEEKKLWDEFRRISESTGAIRSIYTLFGYRAPYYNIPKEKYSAANVMGLNEKIAVIKINGAITEASARKAEKALRSVKEQKDVKCVVLRVDSPGGSINACETIYQEIQDLPQKVIVSFGNVSASGGYYISANADRIFASPTTVTGSIGAFMLRMDLRGLAKRYGITFDSIPTSPLSGSFDPFYSATPEMVDNFAIASDRAYLRFKSLVSEGRKMDMDAVEAVSRGRVWTGEQAKEIGLVDELGGLHRALAFAQRCTSTGHAQIVQWPPKKSLWEMLMNRGSDDTEDSVEDVELPEVAELALSQLVQRCHWFSRETPFAQASSGSDDIFSPLTSFRPVTTGIMLAANENTAIQCLLEENEMMLPPVVSQFSCNVWES